MVSVERLRAARGVARPSVHPVVRTNRAPWPLAGTSRIFAALAGAVALVNLMGWAFGVDALTQVVPGPPSMKINTAIALLLLALCAFVSRPVALGVAALVELAVLATLAEYVSGASLGVDQMLARDPASIQFPGRMSVVTAASIGLIAAAVLLAGSRRVGQLCALVPLLIGALTLLGYAYDVPLLYAVRPISTMAVQTAAAMVLLSIAVLAGVPGGALSWAVSGQDAGAALIRRLLPVALVGLPVVGFLALFGQHRGWFNSGTTTALTVVASAALIGAFTWTAARRVSRAERTRRRAIEELTELRDDLERQVDERAEQLQRRRNEIAVLEDRHRIAADLHDIVIQRLFAAGMFLQADTSVDPNTRKRVDTAVEAMDSAILDLRASIFELEGRGSAMRLELVDALRKVCTESGRMLGFAPALVVDDPHNAREHAREDVLAVVREALANVARHAGATLVTVEFSAADGIVALTVTDDGHGMIEPVRSSGTRNMIARARRYGGDCTWTVIEPRGTRVHWQVPAASPVSAA